MKFILIKRIIGNGNPGNPVVFEWWEQRGDKLFASNKQTWNLLLSNDVILETVECKDWNQLMTPERLKQTSVYQNLYKNSTDKSLKIGWLAPNGKMHYCKYSDHISYVHVILQSTVPDLTKQGWIHIFKDLDFLYASQLTSEQIITATEELGIEVFDNNLI